MKRAGLALIALVLLAGCGPDPSAAGEVTSRAKGAGHSYNITVRGADGEARTYTTMDAGVFGRCGRGARWPDCKR